MTKKSLILLQKHKPVPLTIKLTRCVFKALIRTAGLCLSQPGRNMQQTAAHISEIADTANI